jgi:hypothetical protein
MLVACLGLESKEGHRYTVVYQEIEGGRGKQEEENTKKDKR